MKWIYDLSYEQVREEVSLLGMKPFVADQVFSWLYIKNLQDIGLWSNISKRNREVLAGYFDTALNRVRNVFDDGHGTCKSLIELRDGRCIEAVLIPEKGHYTFCISTQVGCPLGCRFCATGRLGFKRNLDTGEILSQVLLLRKKLPAGYAGKINIVIMGMGEPLLNYENLKRALTIITADRWMAFSSRGVTLSTAGILAGIRDFERDFPGIKISFSLNAPDADLREELMPISKKEKLDRILDYFRSTAAKRKRRVTFEYVMLKGVNDSIRDARKVAAMLRGIPCKVNLIPYNRNRDIDFETPEERTVKAFSDYLYSTGYTAVIRWSKGGDIKSACGQLALETPAKKCEDKDDGEQDKQNE